jgi:hypothetical protein
MASAAAAAVAPAGAKEDPKDARMEAFLKTAKYPLLRSHDMLTEAREEAVEMIVMAVEKHASDLEKCSKVR